MAKARLMRLRWDGTMLRFGLRGVAGYAVHSDGNGISFAPFAGPVWSMTRLPMQRTARAAKRAVMQHVLASMAREVERHGKITARKRARKGR